jgi:hypothetical protein
MDSCLLDKIYSLTSTADTSINFPSSTRNPEIQHDSLYRYGADALLLHEVERQLYLVLLPLSEINQCHNGKRTLWS